jgi:uncharacterized protein YaaN involved in tellurite resistance
MNTSTPVLPLPTAGDLSPAQAQEAQALAAQLTQASLSDMHAFGQDTGQKMNTCSDELLTHMRHSDLEVVGGKLSEIVSTAQRLNLHGFSTQRSKVPVLGAMLDKIKQRKNDFVHQFQGVRSHIDQLMSEVETMQQGLLQRVQALDAAFDAVRTEHDELAVHVHAGELALAHMQTELEQSAASALTPLQAQLQQDRRQAMQALDKRVADLRMLQQAALQQLRQSMIGHMNTRTPLLPQS